MCDYICGLYMFNATVYKFLCVICSIKRTKFMNFDDLIFTCAKGDASSCLPNLVVLADLELMVWPLLDCPGHITVTYSLCFPNFFFIFHCYLFLVFAHFSQDNPFISRVIFPPFFLLFYPSKLFWFLAVETLCYCSI